MEITIFENKDTVRILEANDLHKRAKDITTIEGYVRCADAVQKQLMRDCEKLGADIFISGGDWYDKGYSVDTAATIADYDSDIEFSQRMKGHFYGVIGNHIRLGLETNPELYIIQPHSKYKTRKQTARQEPIMKTPDIIRVHDVQISLVHYKGDHATVLDYRVERQPWAKYHIAIYHTSQVIPASKLAEVNMAYATNSTTAKIAETLTGVDLAIVGHIHKPIGQFPVNNTKGTTTMIVPGSLTNVDAGDINRHHIINLPVIDIHKDSTVTVSYHQFDLLTNMVTFKKKNVEKSEERLRSLRGKSIKELNNPEDVVAILGSSEEQYSSLNGFMRSQGYTDIDKRLVSSIIENPDDLKKLLEIYSEYGNVGV